MAVSAGESTEWGIFSIGLPDDVYSVFDPDRPSDQLAEELRRWLEERDDLVSTNRQELVRRSVAFLDHAASLDAQLTAIGVTEQHSLTIVRDLMVLTFPSDHVDRAAEAEAIATAHRERAGDDELITLVELPVGPAVRVEAITDADTRADRPALALLSVQFWIPLESPTVMMLTLLSSSVGFAADLAAELDEIATTVEIA